MDDIVLPDIFNIIKKDPILNKNIIVLWIVFRNTEILSIRFASTGSSPR
jgi:hypothetical protein